MDNGADDRTLEPEDPDACDLEGWSRTIETNARRPVTDLLEEGRRTDPGWHDGDLRPWAEAAATVDPRVPTWLRSPEIDEWREDLDGAGHSVRRDRFEAYTAALVGFLDRVHGAAS